VWKISGAGFQRTFACETAKQQGNARIENKYKFVSRGKGQELHVQVGRSAGFSAESYKENPAEDVIPILLPWGEQKSARYRFREDGYYPVE
jgi:hypothetical protein